jgi:hypothetical protein
MILEGKSGEASVADHVTLAFLFTGVWTVSGNGD